MGRMLFLVYKIMGRMRGIYIMDITREKTMRIVNYIFAVLIIFVHFMKQCYVSYLQGML